MCTSRIVFVCRVCERPRQDIETPSRFGRSVADTVVEELAASCIWKKENERFGKRRTQPVSTICASDLAWLLQRFVFKVRIVWQSYQQGIVLFSLSLSHSFSLYWLSYLPACMQWLRFYGPSVQLPANLSFVPPSLSLDIFPKNEQLGINKSTQEQRRWWKLQSPKQKIGPTSNRCPSFASYFIENQPLVKCVEPVLHQWRTPDLRLVSLGDIQLTANCRSQTAGRKPQVDIQFVSDPGLIFKNIRPGWGRGLISGG